MDSDGFVHVREIPVGSPRECLSHTYCMFSACALVYAVLNDASSLDILLNRFANVFVRRFCNNVLTI